MKTRSQGSHALVNKLRFKPSRDIPSYMMVLPAMVFLFLFTYMPMYGIIIAFKDYSPFRGIMASYWVGFKHFGFLADESFWRVFRNTIAINIYDIIFGFPIPILLAICLNELVSKRFKKIVQVVTYLPHFISWVVVSGIFVTLLNPQFGLVFKWLP
ncbi:MAG: sugar ABC transporter permease [Clostridiaceae bacterium]|nr:sugar ABC transporter permease [Clostridiaceae bacterium]